MIEYTNTVDDGVALTEHHARNSPNARQQWWAGAIAAVVVITILLRSDGASLWQHLVVAAFVLALYWPVYRWYFRWNTRRLYREASGKGDFGRHRLTLGDAGILAENDLGRAELRYEALQRVVETPTHVFIFVGALSAHIVPRTRIVAGDLNAFLSDLRARVSGTR
jgi:hypothetical protein